MTPKAKAALQWFADNGPIGWFDASSPSTVTRKRLLRAGLIEEVNPKGQVGLLKFQITDAGKAALPRG